ncbi:MAG TPA: helix-turn-helix transcriptional regulator, partial [Trebonia sp.]
MLREDAGFATQEAFAARISYSQDAVSRVETGDRIPTDKMYLPWLAACEATRREKRILDDLLAHARKVHGPVPEFFELYLKRETAAAFLRLWALNVLPGLLQTYEYADAMFMAAGFDEDEAAEKAAARAERRANVEGPHAKQVTATIYEPVLYRRVGTPEVMAQQLADLLEVSQRPNVVMQVVRDTGYFPGLRGQFEIASGNGIPDTLVMYNVEDHPGRSRPSRQGRRVVRANSRPRAPHRGVAGH